MSPMSPIGLPTDTTRLCRCGAAAVALLWATPPGERRLQDRALCASCWPADRPLPPPPVVVQGPVLDPIPLPASAACRHPGPAPVGPTPSGEGYPSERSGGPAPAQAEPAAVAEVEAPGVATPPGAAGAPVADPTPDPMEAPVSDTPALSPSERGSLGAAARRSIAAERIDALRLWQSPSGLCPMVDRGARCDAPSARAAGRYAGCCGRHRALLARARLSLEEIPWESEREAAPFGCDTLPIAGRDVVARNQRLEDLSEDLEDLSEDDPEWEVPETGLIVYEVGDLGGDDLPARCHPGVLLLGHRPAVARAGHLLGQTVELVPVGRIAGLEADLERLDGYRRDRDAAAPMVREIAGLLSDPGSSDTGMSRGLTALPLPELLGVLAGTIRSQRQRIAEMEEDASRVRVLLRSALAGESPDSHDCDPRDGLAGQVHSAWSAISAAASMARADRSLAPGLAAVRAGAERQQELCEDLAIALGYDAPDADPDTRWRALLARGAALRDADTGPCERPDAEPNAWDAWLAQGECERCADYRAEALGLRSERDHLLGWQEGALAALAALRGGGR